MFVFCPLFWYRLWTEHEAANESIWFKLWLTFVVGIAIVFVVGLVATTIWLWPPIGLLFAGFIVGTSVAETRWWSKLTQ